MWCSAMIKIKWTNRGDSECDFHEKNISDIIAGIFKDKVARFRKLYEFNQR